MYHGRREETQAVGTQLEDVAFLDNLRASLEFYPFEKLSEHLDGLGARNKRNLRISVKYPCDEGGMVRLHVVHDQVVRLAAAKGLGQVGLPLLFHAHVRSVHNGDPVVKDHIGIVGHSFGYDILALEEIEVEVVDSDILDCAVEGDCHLAWFLCCANIANCFEKWIRIAIFV